MTKMKKLVLSAFFIFSLLFFLTGKSKATEESDFKFEISFTSEARSESVTGRVYLIISRNKEKEPRFQTRRSLSPPFFGVDVENLNPEEGAIIDKEVLGFPLKGIENIPPGDYYIQGFVNIYTKFERSDGYTVWLHNDQWEGQHWNRSPGNIYSDVEKVHIDPSKSKPIKISCNNVIPPIEVPEDTQWVKRIKFQSKILSEFWGQPIYLGATILLPRDYDKNTELYYPVNYLQGHFSLSAPKGFLTEDPGPETTRRRRGYEFYKIWNSADCPAMIFVTFQHPCPYFDDSYAVNSANCGPYGDAIKTELIPAVEEKFRVIQKPYARVLEGGSTGGWESLALQIFYPDFFGGAFSYCPDPVDFRDVEGIHIYDDENAFYRKNGWRKVPNPDSRRADGSLILMAQQIIQYEHVLGTKGRSGEQWDIWQAVYGPVGEDGYTKPLFDKVTGKIDKSVARYWKENYDLRYYLEKNWSYVGPKIKGKLYIFTGDMDTYYLNNPVHMLQEFLESTKHPHYPGYFMYAPRKTHCWTGPFTPLERMQFIADHIAKNTPEGESLHWLKR